MPVTARKMLDISDDKGSFDSNLVAKFKKDIQNGQVISYDPQRKMLFFKAEVTGSAGKVYPVEIQFLQVEGNPAQLTAGLLPPDLLDHNIKVDCHCHDFINNNKQGPCWDHGCAIYKDHKELKKAWEKEYAAHRKVTGKPKKIITNPHIYNPENQPLGCKHIISVLKDIESLIQAE